jgi:type IV pilus assembly protein PilN
VSARIPINLASEPFRRDRPMLVASAAFGIVLVALMGVLVFLILSERNRQTDSRAAVARLNAEARTLSDEQARLEGTLRLPMNAEVLERSLLLNTLIQHKSISWTKMFADIESVKPDNVKINQVTLDMEVGAQNPAAAIELLKRLEESPLFGPTNLSRSAPPTQNEPLYRYRVVVSYAQKL